MLKVVFLAICAAAFAAPALPNIVQLAESDPDLSTLVTAVKAAGLVDTLSNPSASLTVFAPTNEAFDALGKDVVERLLRPENKAELVEVLTYHVLPARAPASSLHNGEAVKTVEGSEVFVGINSNGVFVNEAKVVKTDLQASNGIVHVVSSVILPPYNGTIVKIAEETRFLSILVKLVVAADLASTLSAPGTFTVFAPSDRAFEALGKEELERLLKPENKAELTKILTYHVAGSVFFAQDLTNNQQIATVQGSPVTAHIQDHEIEINNARVIADNAFGSNGIVHVIDKVLLPPKTAVGSAKLPNIVDLAASDPDLSTLVTAVKAAGLVNVLSNPAATLTVFAPTNEAFAALPAGVLDNLLKPENKQELIQVLTYHVLGFEAHSSSLHDGQVVKTVEGASSFIGINSNGVFVNEAKVVKADLQASNGVVHVVGSVILPPSNKTIVGLAEATPALSTLVKAVVAADLASVLSGAGTFTVFAPTDDAFNALPPGTLEKLLQPANKPELVKILTYHVLGAVAFSEDLVDGKQYTTLEKQDVTVHISGSSVTVNDATVQIANVFGSNGVVHVINKVLLPPTMNL